MEDLLTPDGIFTLFLVNRETTLEESEEAESIFEETEPEIGSMGFKTLPAAILTLSRVLGARHSKLIPRRFKKTQTSCSCDVAVFTNILRTLLWLAVDTGRFLHFKEYLLGLGLLALPLQRELLHSCEAFGFAHRPRHE
ncbi:uncharacterized protein LOC114740054 [Neltuma alba]|uniref:uncharacterized protein LOC114740054 n=1 Tax=Neltuma alba TaxID=207710 RepID=UPI0010A392A2|nr:uncharacterized protein LOC114740054 [Prosopis alba]